MERYMRSYVVWNAANTEGFATTDYQLAYEVRKGAIDNCFDGTGKQSFVAQAFCNTYSNHEDCTIEEIEESIIKDI
jgi:hypothetical protein